MKSLLWIAGVALFAMSAAAGAMDLIEFNRTKYAAQNGDVEAMMTVAKVFLNGDGHIGQDDEQAFHYFQKAAEAGDPEAMFYVGECYFYGRGVDLDMNQSIRWLRESADRGNREAAHALSQIPHQYRYTHPDNQPRPTTAPQGLGGMVGPGPAQPPDWEQGQEDRREKLQRVTREARSGDVESQYQLGMMYLEGDGVRRDYRQAFNWFQEAAHRGLARAMHQLAEMYQHGMGVPRNHDMANAWAYQAKIHGYQ